MATPSVRADVRLARRSRVASACLVIVLLGVSLFAVGSSRATGEAADRAVTASMLSESYDRAAAAVAAQQSWEREYRLVPRPEVEESFDGAVEAFELAMSEVRTRGTASDVDLVDRTIPVHEDYVRAVKQLFRAHDRGDEAAVLQIDRFTAEPAFEDIEATVLIAALIKHEASLGQLRKLERLERVTQYLTPLVFVLGLIVAGLLGLVTRGYRRLLVKERAQAVHEAMHDPLSGLPNRTLLNARLEEACRTSKDVALLLIDLDRFKEVNDTFGHFYGDQLLTQVGARLASSMREIDTVARLGGDEFAILLPGIRSTADAMEIALRLRTELQPSFRILGVDLNVDASIGVVVSREHGRDAGGLLQRADIAMYVAKNQGLGVFAYTPDVDTHSPEKLSLLGELRDALQEHQLVLYYQPKVAVTTGELIGAEALLRWNHPQRGLIPAAEFIPMAEHTELIMPLTDYVLRAAVKQASRWATQGRGIPVAVNLSARNLVDSRLPDQVSRLLADRNLDPALLILEVTESALMSDPIRAKKSLERLHTSGVRISIDDFGAGYTSLSQLKTLPVSELKIDQSFVSTMVEEPVNALIVESVIELGHNLGLTIVGEGIEDERTLTWLKGMGCDVAQGFHFGRPMPADEFENRLANPRSVAPARAQ